MKKTICIFCITFTLALTGCAFPAAYEQNTNESADSDYINIGNRLTIHNTVDLYDAQLYLLAGEFLNAETAERNLSDWLEAGRSNYEVSEEKSLTCNGQDYTVISYRFINEENPYSHGISAFGVYENLAVCAELTCQEDYGEDLSEMLTTFLENCSYQ